MSKVTIKTSWKDVINYLKENELTREQRVDLLNLFNKQINAFPFEDVLQITPSGLILANGKVLDLQQREAFITGAKSLMGNYTFQVLSDQIMFQALKKGVHDSTQFDDVYFSKVALYVFDLYKRYLEKLDKL